MDDVPREQAGFLDSSRVSVLGMIALCLIVTTTLYFATDSQTESVSGIANVLVTPSRVPEGFTRTSVTMWEALGAPSDPGEAAILGLAFRPSDQSFSGADEASLSIHIEDRLAVTASRLEHDTYRCVQIIDGEEVSIDADCRRLAEESECSGLGRIEVGQLDAEACIKEYVENLEEYLEHAPAGVALGESADVSFTRRTIRGRPSLLVEADNFGVSILTVEGGGVISIVEGLGLSRDAVIEVAEGLRPASLTEFQSYMG